MRKVDVDSAFAAATATMKPDVKHDWRVCFKVMRFLEHLSPICVLVLKYGLNPLKQ